MSKTRIGHIGFGDHRFQGRSVLNDLIDQMDVLDLIWFGITRKTLLPEEKQLLSWMAASCTAADARVWPLKITRILSSYGNAYAGFYGAQLATPSDRIGAGSLGQSARALTDMMASIQASGGEVSPQSVRPVLVRFLEKNSKLNGFGVPFRKTDERLEALMKRIQEHHHSAQSKPYWRLMNVLIDLMRELKSVEPNAGITMVALLLDLGIPPEKAPFVCSLVLMAPAFSSHALEAIGDEYSSWRLLPAEQISYQGKPRRTVAP